MLRLFLNATSRSTQPASPHCLHGYQLASSLSHYACPAISLRIDEILTAPTTWLLPDPIGSMVGRTDRFAGMPHKESAGGVKPTLPAISRPTLPPAPCRSRVKKPDWLAPKALSCVLTTHLVTALCFSVVHRSGCCARSGWSAAALSFFAQHHGLSVLILLGGFPCL